jgi:WD40 repeat protein
VRDARSLVAGRGAYQHRARLRTTAGLPDLRPVAAEAGAAEGDPRAVYTWAGPPDSHTLSLVRSYTPPDGGAPRLVVPVRDGRNLCVWHTGTGALLRALQGSEREVAFTSLVTYQPRSDGGPRVAAGSGGGHLCVWDGDDFQVLHAIQTNPGGSAVECLAVYEEPTRGRTRLVTG